ncbi:MAG: hypothetical protein WD801_01405 [Gemmatimonadaceae bacterium]
MSSERNGPGAADHAGQAAGGITGMLAGAAIGTIAGPIGVLLGGIAGAIGGWWSGRALVEAAEGITDEDDAFYRADLEREPHPDWSYDDVRGAYYLGDVAAANPDYADRRFEEVEPDLARAWGNRELAPGGWDSVRRLCAVGFERGKERRQRTRPDTPDRRAAATG